MPSTTFDLDQSRRTRILLIRHGVVAPEARDRFNGRTEAPLDPEGQAQLHRVADYLSADPPTAIYSSPLQRCRDSAAVLGRAFGLEVRIEPDLREMDFGELDGLNYAEAHQRFPGESRAWYHDLAGYRLPGAETMSEVQERAWAALEAVVAGHPGTTVAVQAHGAVNRLILARVLDLAIDQILTLAQDYGCLNILDFWTDRVIIKGLNFQPGPCLPPRPFDGT